MRHAVLAGVLAILAVALVALAQPPGREVLADVEQYMHGGCVVVDVRFHMPVVKLAHFPASETAQLRMDLQLLQHPDTLPEGHRESARLAASPVRWVEFEAGQRGRGTLQVEFTAVTRFTVVQGRDFRSIVIAVPERDGAAPCSAEDLHNRP